MAIKLLTFLPGRGRLGSWPKTLRGANSVVIIGLVAAVLIVVNAVAAYRDDRLDWSETRRFTLAPRTFELLQQLGQEVTSYGFVEKGSDEERLATDLLETYRTQSPKIRYHALDPDQHPAQAKEFGVNQYGTLVVTTANGRQARGTALTESEVTGSLLRALREHGQSVYFLEGHGEHELTDSGKEGYFQLRAILEQEGYTPKSARLLNGEPIPADAASVVVAGPKRSLQLAEVESIKQYLDRGGRLAVLADPLIDTGLEPLLVHWGITLGPGVVVDQEGRTFGGSYTLPLVTTYSVHQIVRELKLPTLFPEARPLLLNVNTPTAGLNALAQTSGQSWAELDVAVRPPQYDPNREKRGPFVLAVAAAPRNMLSDVKGSPRMVVVGDSDFLSNVYFNFSGNRDLFLNMLNWLMQGLDSYTIRPQPVNVSPIILSEHQARVLFVVPVVAVPLLITCAGWGIWRYRRMRV